MAEKIFGANGETSVKLNEDDFEDSPVTEQEIVMNKCLQNAYRMHESTGDKMVEGVVQVLKDGNVLHVFRHCWNKSKTTNLYYDVTKDKVWLTPEYEEELREKGITGEITYRYFAGYDYDSPNLSNTDRGEELGFYYNFDEEIKRM